jgi:acyl-coenzyme A thioesterase PaaI-like protein
MMKNLNTFLPVLAVKAETSGFWLLVLNRLLGRVIPFNRPHGFSLVEIGSDYIVASAPYKRGNFNHIKGIHACAIATVAEFSAGFLLLAKLDLKRYRLIMARIEVEYRYQAKQRIFSKCTALQEQIENTIIGPLRHQDQVTVDMVSEISDADGNDIARAVTTWQIKHWDQVRTRL